MRSGHYYCDILDFNTGIWWRFDDDTTNKLAGLPDNVYSVQWLTKPENKNERRTSCDDRCIKDFFCGIY